MKNKIVYLLLFLCLCCFVSAALYIKVNGSANTTSISNNIADDTTNYECKHIETNNMELNAFKINYTYNIEVKKDKVVKTEEYKNIYFNTYDDFMRIYSKYNGAENDGYKVIGYDFDNNYLAISKSEKQNISFSEYKTNNKILDEYCSIKTKNSIKKEKKVAKKDKTYICKYNNLVSYITVNNNNIITSVMNGTIHKIDTQEEYNNLKNTLKENEVLKYIYDDNNLNITQLNKMFVYDDMNYDNYISTSLSNYTCVLSENE